jgi:hypothetical protein
MTARFHPLADQELTEAAEFYEARAGAPRVRVAASAEVVRRQQSLSERPVAPIARTARIEDAAEAAACLAELGYATSAIGVAESIRGCTADNGTVLIAVDPAQDRVLEVVGVHLIPLRAYLVHPSLT